MRSKVAGLAVACAGALAMAAAGVAATQPTLTGETLSPGTSTTVNTCSPDGGSATIDFDGAAVGTYPGTYTAHVGLRYSPTGDGSTLSFSGAETFSVLSGAESVSGMKVISGTGRCVGPDFIVDFTGTYTATIFTSAGTYNDEGTTAGSIHTPTGLAESFTSTLTVPVVVAPTDRDHCKKDGWKSFGIFKNQGDCVSYVATNGKNKPTH